MNFAQEIRFNLIPSILNFFGAFGDKIGMILQTLKVSEIPKREISGAFNFYRKQLSLGF